MAYGRVLSHGFKKRKIKRLIFYICLIALPVLQFCIFYIYVNFNSLLLAFKEYDYYTGEYSWVYLENFRKVIADIFNEPVLQVALKNTLLAFALGLCIGTTFPVFVSYYIFKKRIFHRVFRTILFLPTIVSSLAIVLAYKYFSELVVPTVWLSITGEEIRGLLTNQATNMYAVLFFTYWFGFGSTFLLYTSTMSGISESIIESAKLDGATPFQEFIHIVLPMIYPTFVTFVVVSISTLFSNQINLYSLYGRGASPKLYTIGYYLYRQVSFQNISDFPYLSAFGLLCTAVVAPMCLGIKRLLEKTGPSAE